jgi:hypothetical protein
VIGSSSNRLGICFSKQNEDIYRSLASLLLDQGRVGEAEAIMARMYFSHMRDHVRSDARDSDIIKLLPEEQKLSDQLRQAGSKLFAAMMARRGAFAADLIADKAGRPSLPTLASLRMELISSGRTIRNVEARGLAVPPRNW